MRNAIAKRFIRAYWTETNIMISPKRMAMAQLTKLDIAVLLGLAIMLFMSLHQERYFQTMRGDIIGITGDWLALEEDGYGLKLDVKGYSGYSRAETTGILIAATKTELFVYNGTVVRICNDQATCDITPMVIRAYAIKQDKRTAQMEQASIADVVQQMNEMKKKSTIWTLEIGKIGNGTSTPVTITAPLAFATIYRGDQEILHATIEELSRMDQNAIADKAQILVISVQGQ